MYALLAVLREVLSGQHMWDVLEAQWPGLGRFPELREELRDLPTPMRSASGTKILLALSEWAISVPEVRRAPCSHHFQKDFRGFQRVP